MNTTTRVGKIGHLPLEVREHLNRRLQAGETGRKLIAWLNALPEVRAVLAAEFGGRPINEPNFTAWRQGGYRQWLMEQEARAVAREFAQNSLGGLPEAGLQFSDAMAAWITAHFAVIAREDLAALEGEKRWHWLRTMSADVVALRRGDHRAQQLDLERDWQELLKVQAELHGLCVRREPIPRLRVRRRAPKT